MTPAQSTMWGIGLTTTVVLHGLIIGFVVVGSRFGRGAAEAAQFRQVVDVEAVKFGKKRDLSFLPHKQAVVANHGPAPLVNLTDNAQALPRPPGPEQKPPEVVDPLQTSHSKLFQNLDEPEQPGAAEEGDPNGLRGGTALVGKGPIYYQHLKAAVQNAWSVPTTIPEKDLQRLAAQACFKIDGDGKMIKVEISRPSGNERYDATLVDALAAVKATWNEPPTPDVKEAVTTDGVCINFKGSEQR